MNADDYYNVTTLKNGMVLEDWLINKNWWIQKRSWVKENGQTTNMVVKSREAQNFKEIYFLQTEVYEEEKPMNNKCKNKNILPLEELERA